MPMWSAWVERFKGRVLPYYSQCRQKQPLAETNLDKAIAIISATDCGVIGGSDK